MIIFPGGPLTWYTHSPDGSCWALSLACSTSSLHSSLSFLVKSWVTMTDLNLESKCLILYSDSITKFLTFLLTNWMKIGLGESNIPQIVRDAQFSSLPRPSTKHLNHLIVAYKISCHAQFFLQHCLHYSLRLCEL